MRFSRLTTAVFAAAVFAVPVHAQHWSGPLFSSPLQQDRVEILTFDTNGAGIGVAVAVRPFASAPDLRLRVGIMDGYGTGAFELPSQPLARDRRVAYMAGIDYAVPLTPNASGPVRASFVTGIGVGVNASTLVSAPVGISVGYDGGWVRPYISPRVVLEHHSGTGYTDGVRVKGLVDVGVDIDLPLGATLRAALTTGSYGGGGIGISF